MLHPIFTPEKQEKRDIGLNYLTIEDFLPARHHVPFPQTDILVKIATMKAFSPVGLLAP